MKANEFSAPLDAFAKAITIGVSLLLLAIPIINYIAARQERSAESALLISLFSLVVCGGILLGAWAYAPRRYEISATGIQIHRPRNTIVIPYGDIQLVRELQPQDMKGTVRTFGNGGLFGFTGRFYNRQLGHFQMQATAWRKGVLVKAQKTVIITPHPQPRFLEMLRSYVPASALTV